MAPQDRVLRSLRNGRRSFLGVMEIVEGVGIGSGGKRGKPRPTMNATASNGTATW